MGQIERNKINNKTKQTSPKAPLFSSVVKVPYDNLDTGEGGDISQGVKYHIYIRVRKQFHLLDVLNKKL